MSKINNSHLENLNFEILDFLPFPIVLITKNNSFYWLNHSAEIFFQSSRMMLLGTALTSIIATDSNFLLMVRRARAQSISVGDQGVELAGPKIGLKLINVQITPFGDREPCLLISIQERQIKGITKQHRSSLENFMKMGNSKNG